MKKLLLLAIIAALNSSMLVAATEVHDRVVSSAVALKEIFLRSGHPRREKGRVHIWSQLRERRNFLQDR